MKIIDLKSGNTKDALDVLDDLRVKVSAGEIIAFAIVGIEPDDTTRSWTSTTRPVSRLRMMGAIANLEQCFHNDPDV